MKFKAKTSTADGRLTKDKIYQGGFVMTNQYYGSGQMCLRIIVYDNRNEWMTFDPKVFEPAE